MLQLSHTAKKSNKFHVLLKFFHSFPIIGLATILMGLATTGAINNVCGNQAEMWILQLKLSQAKNLFDTFAGNR